jgi:hypothetical protein
VRDGDLPWGAQPGRDPMRDVLLFMPCSATKLPYHDQPRRLYTGPMWQTLRTHLGKFPWRNVIVLSGKYGFLRSQEFIATYNEELTPAKADYVIGRGLDGVRDHFGKCSGAASMRMVFEHDRRGRAYERVIIAGAGDYRRVFEAFTGMLKDAGMVASDAPVDQVAGGIGEQRQQLGQWLRDLNCA